MRKTDARQDRDFSTPHPGPLLVRGGEGDILLDDFPRAALADSLCPGLSSVGPSALRTELDPFSKVISEGRAAALRRPRAVQARNQFEQLQF